MRKVKLLCLFAALGLCFTLCAPVCAVGDFVVKDGVLTQYRGRGGDVVIPAGVREIGDAVFYKNERVESVTLPEGLVSIGCAAFNGTSIRELILPEGLREIGYSAFGDCALLERAYVPDSVCELPDAVFYRCTSLRELVLPEGVKAPGSLSFYGCASLESVENAPGPWAESIALSRELLELEPEPGDYLEEPSRVVRALAAELTEGIEGEYDRARAICEWVVENIAYDDYEAEGRGFGDVDLMPEAILQSRRTVCEGYTRLTQSLLRAAGIACMHIIGHSTGSPEVWHAWNLAYIEGRWRWLDICWGMDWFDAINYSMSTTGTGGFATHNASIAHFQSPGIEYSAILFCFLSGTNFTLLYFTMAKLRFRELFMNSEFRLYFILVAAFSLFIAYELVVHNGYDVEHALRSSLFQVTAFITTTGFFSDDAGLWPHVTWVVLSFCMFIGACSGSTSGGIKCVRGVMLLRIVRNEFRQILHPNAVLPLKIDSTNVPNNKRVTLLAFLTVDLILILVCSFIFIVQGIESTNAVTVTLSSLGNVGPALGSDIGPTMSWSSLPDNVKWICTLLMLVGRLEIFSVLVIFTSAFWKDN